MSALGHAIPSQLLLSNGHWDVGRCLPSCALGSPGSEAQRCSSPDTQETLIRAKYGLGFPHLSTV